MTTLLSVNVNKVATLRNQRDGDVPSVLGLAKVALDAGAHGITVHPRPDERHIRAADCDAIANEFANGHFRGEFNIEGNPLDFGGGHLMPILRRIRPTQATLVPDGPDVFTSNQGWDFRAQATELAEAIARLHAVGARVVLFADPDPDAMAHAAATGADRVELYTEPYAVTEPRSQQRSKQLKRYRLTAIAARDAGLGVNAGHDLNRENLVDFLAEVPNVEEVSIGHALIADALALGLSETVRRYCEIVRGTRADSP